MGSLFSAKNKEVFYSVKHEQPGNGSVYWVSVLHSP